MYFSDGRSKSQGRVNVDFPRERKAEVPQIINNLKAYTGSKSTLDMLNPLRGGLSFLKAAGVL